MHFFMHWVSECVAADVIYLQNGLQFIVSFTNVKGFLFFNERFIREYKDGNAWNSSLYQSLPKSTTIQVLLDISLFMTCHSQDLISPSIQKLFKLASNAHIPSI